MPRHLSVGTAIEKNRVASEYAFLPLLVLAVRDPATNEVVDVVRIANNNEDITYQGYTYTAAAFEFEVKQESNKLPDINLTARDYTRAIQEKMQTYRGGTGSDVTIMVVNTGNMDQPPEVEETFKVVRARAEGYNVNFTLGAENPLTKRFPHRIMFRDRCMWRYKGPQCRYKGPLKTCDYTLQGPNGCAAHNNAANFGGYPGIRRGG